MPRPLIHRAALYNYLPQVPSWFCNVGHFAGKYRFRRKVREKYRKESVPTCPWCNENDFIFIANQERHGLATEVMLCNACAFMFTTLRWDEPSLSDHYQRDYRDIERGIIPDIHFLMFELQKSKGPLLWPPITAELSARGIVNPQIAEIGCGEGGLLAWIRDNAGAKVTGFELNLDASAFGQSRGLDIRSDHFQANSGRFDVIILEQVLEHLHNPSAFVAMLAASQQQGDLLSIGVPGMMAAGAHYDNNFLVYLDYAHMSHFCLHTLERMVVPHGYRLVRGDETVQALFERISRPGPVTTPPVTADHIAAYLAKIESEYRHKGSHLLRHARPYAKYILVGLKSRMRRWGGDPLFRP